MDTITLDELTGVLPLEKIISLTDDYNAGRVNEDNLESAYQSAVRDVELYAARHYALPLPAVAAVKELHLQLTRCHLFFRRGMQDELIMGQYNVLMRKLKDLTPFSLGIPGVTPAAGRDGAGISVRAPRRTFHNNFMNLDDTSRYVTPDGID